MNYFLEIIQIEIFFIYIIQVFTNYKITFKYYLSILIGSVTVIITCNTNGNEIINIVLPLLVQIIPTIIGIKNQSFKKLLYTKACCISFVTLINSFIIFISGSIKTNNISNRLIEHTTCFAIILIIILLLKNKSISNLIFEIDAMSKKIKIIILIFICGLVAIITCLSTLFRLQLSVSYKIAISSLLFFAILISFVIVFLLISENLSNSYYSRYNKIMQDKVNDDAKHIERITLASEDLRHLKHDIRNMIIGINACLDTNDINAARKYLDDFHKKVVPTREWIHTGNPFLDSLLSDKHERITDNNIKIEFEGLMPTESLKPVDICIVFGNALDNAIEACEKFSKDIEKTIKISIKQSANVILIKITNPIINPVKIHNNNIASSKSTYGHGIGIPSMRKTVEEYNGQLILKSDKESFTIEMSFVLEAVENHVTV